MSAWLELPLSLRGGVDEASRSVEVVAATEGKVMTKAGPEVLRMAGLELDPRRNEPAPLLFDHDPKQQLGSGRGWRIEGRELRGRIYFARTELGEEQWLLARDGHLRGISIGYEVDPKSVRRIRAGEFDGEGEHRVSGPALIANRWRFHEVTVTPLQADPDAGIRARVAFYDSLDVSERSTHPSHKEGSMDPLTTAMSGKTAPAQNGGASPPPPAPQASTTTEQRPAETATRSFAQELPEEISRRRREALIGEVRSFTPPGFEDVARDAILEGLDVEGCRKRLLEQFRSKHKPLGTPEPAPIPASATQQRGADETAKQERALLTPDAVLRALTTGSY